MSAALAIKYSRYCVQLPVNERNIQMNDIVACDLSINKSLEHDSINLLIFMQLIAFDLNPFERSLR